MSSSLKIDRYTLTAKQKQLHTTKILINSIFITSFECTCYYFSRSFKLFIRNMAVANTDVVPILKNFQPYRGTEISLLAKLKLNSIASLVDYFTSI